MKHRLLIAGGLSAMMLTAVGCGNTDKSGDDSAKKPTAIKVWLMEDAKTGWPEVVQRANAAFKAKTGIDTQVEYTQWPTHLQKFDAALAAGSTPDVLELGNTETVKYLADGVLADLTDKKGEFENSSSWSPGLTESCTYQGTLGCVPYYGGARVVIYNKKLFAKAGITHPKPKSLDDLFAMLDKVQKAHAKTPNFSAFFMPGKYWYAAMSFVKDYGGDIAKSDGGKWKGALDSAEAKKGIAKWKELVDKFSKADKTGTENNQFQAMAKGNVAAMLGLGWEAASVPGPADKGGNPKLQGQIGMFPMPSHNAGENMPSFLGGSDLAIPAKGPHQKWAREWLKIYTGTKIETALAGKGNIPNSGSLNDKVPAASQPIAVAAQTSWFTPVAKGWATVESKNILPDALSQIATGKASVPDGLKTANHEITKTLQSGG